MSKRAFFKVFYYDKGIVSSCVYFSFLFARCIVRLVQCCLFC